MNYALVSAVPDRLLRLSRALRWSGGRKLSEIYFRSIPFLIFFQSFFSPLHNTLNIKGQSDFKIIGLYEIYHFWVEEFFT